MNIRLRDRIILVAVALALLWCIPSVGQVLKGSISGTVTDPQGAVVSSAQVKATNIETGVVYTTTSDSSGLFRINLIPTGTYNITITAQGFKTSEVKGKSVAAGADAGLGDIHMAVGETSTTLEIVGTAPLVDTTQAQVTNTFSGTTLATFAGVQENEGLDRLALFVPGIASSRSNNFSNTNGASISSNGLRGRNNDQEIDGQNNNDNSVGGPGLFVSDTEFVQQYVIVTNQFGPEYGRNSGSVVNIITKQGTNAWHGSLYGTENSSFLNALSNTQRNTNKPGSTPCTVGQALICNGFSGPPRSNDEFGGGTIGGPVVKNKLFLFGGFDQEIFSGSSVYTTTSLTPTPAGLAQLPTCGISGNGLSILQNFGPYALSFGNPTPRNPTTATIGICDGKPGDPAKVPVGGVTRVVSTPQHAFNWVLRSDLQLGSDTITGRYLFNRDNFFNLSDLGSAGWVFNEPALSQAGLISWTHNFTPRMVNEARVSFGRLGVEFGGGLNPNEPVAGNLASAFTNISIQGGALGIGPATNLPQSRLVNTWQGQDNWNYVLGKHSLKAGVNWTYQRSPNIFLPQINGAYRFSSLASFLGANNTPGCPGGSAGSCGAPNRVIIAQGQPSLDFREYDTFIYGGDDWKIGQNLTVNLGITWTYYGQPANLFHDITTARESNASTALWLQSLPLSVRTDPQIPAVKNSFGPSVGFAYSPQWGGFLTGHGKTTFRGGYRLLYDPPFYNIFVNISSSAPETFLQTITTGLNAGMLPAVPTGPNVRGALASFIAPNTFDPRTQNETTVSPNFGPDKVHSWSFGVEREVTKNSAFEARYIGNHGFDLFQTVNGNPYLGTTATQTFVTGPPPNIVGGPGLGQTFPGATNGGTGCAATAQSGPANTIGTDVGRVNCGFGVLRVRNNGAFSDYHGLQLEFRANNLFKQLTLRTGYTWSKTLDNVSEIFSTSAGPGNTIFAAQNPFQTGDAERSISGLNYPHVWSILFTEQIPFFKEQHGAIGHLLGGWAISADYLLASGQPFTPAQGVFGTIAQGTTCPGFSTNCANGPGLSNTVANHNNPTPNYYDAAFTNAFVGVDIARPFFGSQNAPSNSVGIYAGDACLFFGVACSSAATQLISFNAFNAAQGPPNSGGFFGCLRGSAPCPVVNVTSNDVRFIINGKTAQSVFGTPFGNVPRNALRDAISNIANVSVFKNIKLGERVTFQLHATALNAFNHFNFTAVDVFTEDAGLVGSFGNGFAQPQFSTANGRTFFIGGKITF